MKISMKGERLKAIIEAAFVAGADASRLAQSNAVDPKWGMPTDDPAEIARRYTQDFARRQIEYRRKTLLDLFEWGE